jgi:hypothetical protein
MKLGVTERQSAVLTYGRPGGLIEAQRRTGRQGEARWLRERVVDSPASYAVEPCCSAHASARSGPQPRASCMRGFDQDAGLAV